LAKKLRFFIVDAYRLTREGGLGWRIGVVMQTCFFALTDILPRDRAVEAIKKTVADELGRDAKALVDMSCQLVDRALDNIHEVPVAGREPDGSPRPPRHSPGELEEVDAVTLALLRGRGADLPVSAFPQGGVWPTGTSRFEKRNVAQEIPLWEPDICIQCAQCALVCPHAAIRTKMFEPSALDGAPASYLHAPCKAPDLKGLSFTVQVAPEDCTGCRLCVEICPARDRANPRRKAINMENQKAVREREKSNYQHFVAIPQLDRSRIQRLDARGSQLLEPLFQFSGACAGCGETPYIKLLTQLFGDRLVIANAPGCSATYGGHLPTTPYSANGEGRGPAWMASSCGDSAELGLGLRLAMDGVRWQAEALLQELASAVGESLASEIVQCHSAGEEEMESQRQRVEALKKALGEMDDVRARSLEAVADYLVPKSLWVIGGDAWASEAGQSGLRQLLAGRHRVNVLLLATQVYADTGGQVGQTTPLGAVAKFSPRAKATPGRDLGLELAREGSAYVAQVALAARMAQTVQAMLDAESFPGPSVLLAYSPCVAHGFDLSRGADEQRLAVATGFWPLYRYDPRNDPGLKIDSGVPKKPVTELMSREMRFRLAEKLDSEGYRRLTAQAQEEVRRRYAELRRRSGLPADEGSS
jgi:pyruvate-ferredoxin/flavodoxin oxidoreductase